MTKKIPLRQCTGCGEMKSKKEMLRIVHTPEDTFVLDRNGKAAGRGAYICDSPECFKAARKHKGLERSFKCAVPEKAYKSLEEELVKNEI